MIYDPIKATGLGFGLLRNDEEESACDVMVLPALKAISYDPAILLGYETFTFSVRIVMPELIAKRFCDMASGEYLDCDYQNFSDLDSVHYWMTISWVYIEPGRNPAYQRFGFGRSDDGRFAIELFSSPDRYTRGAYKSTERSLIFLDESNLKEVVDATRDVLAWLDSEEGRQHYDS